MSPYILSPHTEAADTIPFRIKFDPLHPKFPPAPGAQTEEMKFHLRPFYGHDNRRFADRMMTSDKKGQQRLNSGTVHMEKVIAGVASIDAGLTTPTGEPITTMTEEVYGTLAGWIINRLLKRIAELNEEDDESEEDEGE